MKRHLAILTKGCGQMWARHFCCRKSSQIPEVPCCSCHSAQSNDSLHSSPVSPPEGRQQQQECPRGCQFGEKCVVVFCLIGFPPPILEIQELYTLAGTDINVTCAGHVLTSPSPTLRLQGAPDLPAPGEPAWLLLTIREEDDGRNLSCEASLEIQGQRFIKTTTAQLHVLCEYRPSLPFQSKGYYCPVSRDIGQQLHFRVPTFFFSLKKSKE